MPKSTKTRQRCRNSRNLSGLRNLRQNETSISMGHNDAILNDDQLSYDNDLSINVRPIDIEALRTLIGDEDQNTVGLNAFQRGTEQDNYSDYEFLNECYSDIENQTTIDPTVLENYNNIP